MRAPAPFAAPVAALLAALLLPVEAAALSCLRPDAVRSFNALNDAPERYVVVHGRITFDASLLPEPDTETQREKVTRIPARIEGAALSRGGFTTPYDRDILLDVRCLVVWCGALTNGADHLVFLQLTDSDPLLSVDPCPDRAFQDPTPGLLARMHACILGQDCRPED